MARFDCLCTKILRYMLHTRMPSWEALELVLHSMAAEIAALGVPKPSAAAKKQPKSSQRREYLALLDLDPNVGDISADVLRKAFHRSSILYHPDKSSDPNATVRFQKILTAYEALKKDT